LLLHPQQPSDPPVTAQAIADRVAELRFQTTFMRDVRSDFLLELMRRGQAQMDTWLAQNRAALGRYGSCHIEAEFL